MGAITIDLGQAQDRLPELVERALAGDEVVLTRDGEPVAMIVPILDRDKPLRDTVLAYDDPTEPVAEGDWDALR